MAYITPPLRATGDIITAANWNQDVRNNFIAYETHAHTGVQDGASGVGGMQLISDQVLTVSSTGVAFTAIPTGFKHLQFDIAARSDSGSNNMNLYVNTDSGISYDRQAMILDGAGPVAAGPAQDGTVFIIARAMVPGTLVTGGVFAGMRLRIENYRSAIFDKTINYETGYAAATNTQAAVALGVGHWRSTAAITRVDFVPAAGAFVSGSRFTLYGLA